MAAYTDADVQTCIDWLYSAMHDDRQVPEMAENLLEDLVPRIGARAKAEALREAADALPAATEGVDRAGTKGWESEWARGAYSLAIEESQSALRTSADEIERT